MAASEDVSAGTSTGTPGSGACARDPRVTRTPEGAPTATVPTATVPTATVPTAAVATDGRRGEVLAMLRAANEPLSIAEVAMRLAVHRNTARFHLDTLVESGRAERVTGVPDRPGRPPFMFRATAGMDPAGPRNYHLLAEILTRSIAVEPHPHAKAIAAGRAWGRQIGDRTRPADAVSGSTDSRHARTPDAARTPDYAHDSDLTHDSDTTQAPNTAPDSDMAHDSDIAARDITAVEATQRLEGLLADFGFEPEPGDGRPMTHVVLRHCPFLELAEAGDRISCSVHLGLMQGTLAAMDAPITVTRLDPFVEPDRCVAYLEPATG